MTIIQENGILKLYQGDTGLLKISGIPADKNYRVFFQVQTKDRTLIEPQMFVESNFEDSVILQITADLTDQLTVSANKRYEVYTYGIKLCYSDEQIEDIENTVFIKGQSFGSESRIYVYPKKVEGIK